jgi:translation elongation factor EF-G
MGSSHVQTMLRGVGELHLEIVVDRLRRSHKVEVETGQAYVAYREGISEACSKLVEHDRVVGGRRMYAGMRLTLRPADDVQKVPDILLSEPADQVRRVPRERSGALTEGPCPLCCGRRCRTMRRRACWAVCGMPARGGRGAATR